MRCICGCGKRAVHDHHVVYEQVIERRYRELVRAGTPVRWRSLAQCVNDPRNLVGIAFGCHGGQHGASKKLRLERLPDRCFEFAAELLGPGRAYEYLKRRYAGPDARLDRLLEAWEASRTG
jgi:hypothetical protein